MVDAQHKLESIRALQTPADAARRAIVDGLKTGDRHRQGAPRRRQVRRGDGVRAGEALADLVASSRAVAAEVTERTRQMQALSEALDAHDHRQGRAARRARSRPEPAARHGRTGAGVRRSARPRRDDVQAARAAADAGGVRREEAGRRRSAPRRDQAARRRARQEHLRRSPAASSWSTRSRPKSRSSTRSARAPRPTSRTSPSTAARSPRSRISVDELLSRIGETDERIASIDARRKLIDEVHTKTNTIVHVLDDVRINLETLGEHKAVIDHVAERVNAARVTRCRKRATRCARFSTSASWPSGSRQGIKQLRAAGKPEDVKSATAS